MEKAKIHLNINSTFKNMSYFMMYNYDIWITISIIILVSIITIYFFLKSSIEINKVNWETEQCNPFFMPFGSILNKGVSDDFNEMNFKKCSNNLLFGISIDLKNPISSIFSIFGGIFALASSVMSSIMGFLLYLFNMIMNLFRQLILIITKLIQEISNIFNTISNVVAQVLGFVTIIYNQISILVDSIKYILPVMSTLFMVSVIIPTITFLIFSIAMLIIGYILSHFFCLGCPIVAIFSVIVPLCIMVLIFLLMILTILQSDWDYLKSGADESNLINRQTISPEYETPEKTQERMNK